MWVRRGREVVVQQTPDVFGCRATAPFVSFDNVEPLQQPMACACVVMNTSSASFPYVKEEIVELAKGNPTAAHQGAPLRVGLSPGERFVKVVKLIPQERPARFFGAVPFRLQGVHVRRDWRAASFDVHRRQGFFMEEVRTRRHLPGYGGVGCAVIIPWCISARSASSCSAHC